jgi:hypothetical protein
LLTKITGASVGFGRLVGAISLSRDQCLSQHDLQIEFPLLAQGLVRNAGEEFQSFPELRNCFGHRPARHRLLPSLKEVANRFLC